LRRLNGGRVLAAGLKIRFGDGDIGEGERGRAPKRRSWLFIEGRYSEQCGAALRPIRERVRDNAGEKGSLPNAL
jgi:hypothetical protein